ncbi:MAG: hypothetical protein IPK28_11130 [Devosia sp.]|nr:hypothetical protein [Devosia sp.]
MTIDDEALATAMDLSIRYLPDLCLPDKAIGRPRPGPRRQPFPSPRPRRRSNTAH